jgi:hypothetical protein
LWYFWFHCLAFRQTRAKGKDFCFPFAVPGPLPEQPESSRQIQQLKKETMQAKSPLHFNYQNLHATKSSLKFCSFCSGALSCKLLFGSLWI